METQLNNRYAANMNGVLSCYDRLPTPTRAKKVLRCWKISVLIYQHVSLYLISVPTCSRCGAESLNVRNPDPVGIDVALF